MEEERQGVVSSLIRDGSVEGTMLRAEAVQEVLARLGRGEGVKRIAREMGIDRKTVRRWRRIGEWRAQRRRRRCGIDQFAEFAKRRAPEVGGNGAVLFRELRGLGFQGGYDQVRRFLKPLRDDRRWAEVATVRFETEPGEQAQIDFGQTKVWIGEKPESVHVFVFTLGYSRRLFAVAYPNEKLSSLLDGHERAFRHFDGVPLTCLYDNPRTMVVGRSEGKVLWLPVFEDFARYYGFSPRACQPYRARTKGKTESGVKYVKRNALVGKRFAGWEQMNEWLLEWATTVADVRIHGTTHQRPLDRFAAEKLVPLGLRPPYRFERVKIRRVPSDALVSIGASRYSVPVRYVGTTVTVHETAASYEIFSDGQPIARHAKAARHSVVMEPSHYQGLFRSNRNAAPPAPPKWDPAYLSLGEVHVRDLAIYEALVEAPGGGAL